MVAELPGSKLMVVYQKYEAGAESGHDFGRSRIWSRISHDAGATWVEPRMLVDVAPGDVNVMHPVILRLPSGELLFGCTSTHSGKSSTTMRLFRSSDDGKTFREDRPIWTRSHGWWGQGGGVSLLRLQSGRLLFPFQTVPPEPVKRPVTGEWTGCFWSDDSGRSWHMTKEKVELPGRGAMEPTVAELEDGELVMVLRTTLGGPYLSRSRDAGESWSDPQPTGLKSGDSCPLLRRIPGTNVLLLLWNNTPYISEGHHHFGERTPLTAAVSSDSGRTWRVVGDLAMDPNSEYTNIGCTFTAEGRAIITYMAGKPAWTRRDLSLWCASVEKEWFLGPTVAQEKP